MAPITSLPWILLVSVVVMLSAGSCSTGEEGAVSVENGAQARPRSSEVGELPADALRWCGGHVSGAQAADGRPGPHITWDAYTSRQEVSALEARYAERLGSPSDKREPDCATWRSPPDSPLQVLEICSIAARGPWSECGPPPAEAASIISRSTMARVE